MIAKLGGGHEERQELVSSQVDKYIICVSSSVSCVISGKDRFLWTWVLSDSDS